MCITKAITLLSCLWQALLIDLSITEKKPKTTLLGFSLTIKLYSIWELSSYALLKEFRTGTSKYAALVC